MLGRYLLLAANLSGPGGVQGTSGKLQMRGVIWAASEGMQTSRKLGCPKESWRTFAFFSTLEQSEFQSFLQDVEMLGQNGIVLK